MSAIFYRVLLYNLILFTTTSYATDTDPPIIFNSISSTANDSEWTQTLPDAIIIGAKKCGTRALLKFIGTHPNVSAAGAEAHFFDRFYHMGLDWYRDQMPFSTKYQITIEKTPKYLVDKQVPRRVFHMNPKIKLIVVVRNPVERAISEYVQSKENRIKKRHLTARRLAYNSLNDSTIVHRMIYDQDGQIKLDKPMIKNGLYVEHLKNWLKFFPLDQFLFINGESLVKSPSVEMQRMETFLNLKHVIKREHFVYDHRKGFPCIYKPLESREVKCLNEQKGRKHPVIEKKILDDLQQLYRPYNKEFFETIQQEAWWP